MISVFFSTMVATLIVGSVLMALAYRTGRRNQTIEIQRQLEIWEKGRPMAQKELLNWYIHSGQLNADEQLDAVRLRLLLERQTRQNLTAWSECYRAVVVTHFSPYGYEPPPPQVIGLLAAFKWCCSEVDREHVALVEADLRKDVREMRAEGRGPWFVRFVVAKRVVLGTILPIAWAALIRVLENLAYAMKLLKKLRF